MKIKLLAVGKTDQKNLQLSLDDYTKRIGFYIRFEMQVIPDIKKAKNLSEKEQKQKEGELLLKHIDATDTVILLDEKGKLRTSIEFAAFLQNKMNTVSKQLVFVIGGPYGFSEAVYSRAQAKMSLSTMTFSHQMVRLFFLEQLYRAFTIIRNEPYHHQ